jgi:GntR family transcriptional regulator
MMGWGGGGADVSHAGTSNGAMSLVDGAERAVREWLDPGRFRAGDRLPPEQELAAMLGISRGTLRSALRRLESSGEIVRRQGSGTFVGRIGGPPGLDRRTLRAGSYCARAPGLEFSVADIEIEVRPAGSDAADALGIVPAHATTAITRTIFAGERLAALAHDMVHPDVSLPDAARLRTLLLGGDTMFEVLCLTKTAPAVSRTRISSLLLHPRDSLGRRFGLTAPSACLVLEEVLVGEHADPLLYSWDVVLPGMIEIEVVRSTNTTRPEPIAVRADSL